MIDLAMLDTETEPELLGLDSRLDRLREWGGNVEDAACEAIAIYREAARFMGEFKAYQDRAKDALNGIIEETGCIDWKTDAGRAYVTKSGTRVSYDTKALDALCASDERIARLLDPHRKETQTAGTLTIRAS